MQKKKITMSSGCSSEFLDFVVLSSSLTRSFMKLLNRNGLIIDPCGIPMFALKVMSPLGESMQMYVLVVRKFSSSRKFNLISSLLFSFLVVFRVEPYRMGIWDQLIVLRYMGVFSWSSILWFTSVPIFSKKPVWLGFIPTLLCSFSFSIRCSSRNMRIGDKIILIINIC